ncbi:MAG TPA: isoprenylcysteine carboxylmethyltransferase family protein [Deltaproteobacteria bacterium]|nr:isoprenylcysteine carboxylmethyltransferase family protein [Deltaproteobacteria bacterium]HOM29420.1 isoprenylcysteine carboxylmethyltransferase family protein [Deltaproteobacteria bacterium]HPP80984.1 isoprenylcysteine carboxylmethyltransferase family protein [Deltaproteobacteria bacterium]
MNLDDLKHKWEKVNARTAVLYGAIVLLVVFSNPRWWSCLLGIFPVIAGEALRVWATGHLRKNEELTTSGPYAHLQSPLYLGSYLIGTGLCIMALNPVIWVLGSLVFFLSYIPRKQETEWGRLERKFGEEFLKYKREVNYFFPRIDPYPEGSKHLWSFAQVIENTEHQTALAVGVIALFIIAKLAW